jgi:hypothetical protein
LARKSAAELRLTGPTFYAIVSGRESKIKAKREGEFGTGLAAAVTPPLLQPQQTNREWEPRCND